MTLRMLITGLVACPVICPVICLVICLVAPPTPQDVARDLVAAGPMPAWSTTDAAAVWLATTRPALLELSAWPEGRPEDAVAAEPVRTTVDGDLIGLLVLGGLAPDTRYDTELSIDGRPLGTWSPLRVTTRPVLVDDQPPPDLRFTFGSCAYVNDPEQENPYGGGHEIFDAIAAERPEFMLWVGDNLYFREPDWTSEAGMRRRYAYHRGQPALQRLLGATHHYAIWDDHDFGPNDSDGTFEGKHAALAVFSDYWPMGPDAQGAPVGCARSFRWGDVEFFLLDDRTARSPNDAPRPGKEMLGSAQLEWLVAGLAASDASFKFVACGNQVINPLVLYEGFGLFPDEQRAFFDALVEHRVEGVVFLTGDRHQSELLRVQPLGGAPLIEFTSSPLTAGTADLPQEANNAARVPGTRVSGVRSYGRIEVSGPAGARRLTLSAHDASGRRIWRREVPQMSLKAPR